MHKISHVKHSAGSSKRCNLVAHHQKISEAHWHSRAQDCRSTFWGFWAFLCFWETELNEVWSPSFFSVTWSHTPHSLDSSWTVMLYRQGWGIIWIRIWKACDLTGASSAVLRRNYSVNYRSKRRRRDNSLLLKCMDWRQTGSSLFGLHLSFLRYVNHTWGIFFILRLGFNLDCCKAYKSFGIFFC